MSAPSQSSLHLHQIFYSAETRAQLDPGFIPLDNQANARADWREYWPMRRFLQNETLDDNAYYAFFSPKFRAKTGLDAAAARSFIAAQPPDTDVVLLSPFFDQIAFYWNIFEQGMNHHKGFFETFKKASAVIAPGVVLEELITDSRNTVFSNYFAAKPAFWRAWLAANEALFHIAESGGTDLADALNSKAAYRSDGLPAKIFMMERVATLLLATQPDWRVAWHDPQLTPLDPLFAPYRNELIRLEALKTAANLGDKESREAFRSLRRDIAARTKQAYAARQSGHQQ